MLSPSLGQKGDPLSRGARNGETLLHWAVRCYYIRKYPFTDLIHGLGQSNGLQRMDSSTLTGLVMPVAPYARAFPRPNHTEIHSVAAGYTGVWNSHVRKFRSPVANNSAQKGRRMKDA